MVFLSKYEFRMHMKSLGLRPGKLEHDGSLFCTIAFHSLRNTSGIIEASFYVSRNYPNGRRAVVVVVVVVVVVAVSRKTISPKKNIIPGRQPLSMMPDPFF